MAATGPEQKEKNPSSPIFTIHTVIANPNVQIPLTYSENMYGVTIVINSDDKTCLLISSKEPIQPDAVYNSEGLALRIAPFNSPLAALLEGLRTCSQWAKLEREMSPIKYKGFIATGRIYDLLNGKGSWKELPRQVKRDLRSKEREILQAGIDLPGERLGTWWKRISRHWN